MTTDSNDLTLQGFASDLRRVADIEDVHEMEQRFRELRSRYLPRLAEWREGLDPRHKGLMLYVEDLDSWKNASELRDALLTMAGLFEDTVEQASQGEIQARDVARRVMRRRFSAALGRAGR